MISTGLGNPSTAVRREPESLSMNLYRATLFPA
jgi:hypothetical protein